jgi:hypothetical protein
MIRITSSSRLRPAGKLSEGSTRTRPVARRQFALDVLGQGLERITAHEPATVLGDADGNGLEAAPVDRPEDGGRRCERDLVLP